MDTSLCPVAQTVTYKYHQPVLQFEHGFCIPIALEPAFLEQFSVP